MVTARTEARARKAVRYIGAGSPAAGITPGLLGSETILLTVPDDAIAMVADESARVGGEQLKGKVVLHVSGALDAEVLAAGHVLALEETSGRMLTSAEMKRGEAVRALVALTRQTPENYEKPGAKQAWTGSLSRGDYGVVAAHEEALARFPPEFLEAYQALNRQAARVLPANPDAVLRELEKISENSKEFIKVKRERA
jgi:predicted short-subunit dehydrogenase-like oxidoreductase (DUF2520 family)